MISRQGVNLCPAGLQPMLRVIQLDRWYAYDIDNAADEENLSPGIRNHLVFPRIREICLAGHKSFREVLQHSRQQAILFSIL